MSILCRHGAAILAVCLATTISEAQAPDVSSGSCTPEISRERFTAFFQKTLGEWAVSIRDFDERGTASAEVIQTRAFQWAVGNRFVEEKAFAERPNEGRINVGIMLYSFADDSSVVRMTSFWPRSARRWADLGGCIDSEASQLRATLNSHRPGEAMRKRRVEIGFTSATRMHWRGYATDGAGREYLAEELLYSRR